MSSPSSAAETSGSLASAPFSATGVTALAAAALPTDEVFAALGSTTRGLTTHAADQRRAVAGLNVVAGQRTRLLRVVMGQIRSPLLLLLLLTALASFALDGKDNAIIIGTILLVSVGLGSLNEYRAGRTADALHSSVHHSITTLRDGVVVNLDVTRLVPGDVIHLTLGTVIPADVRIVSADGLSVDESVLTGETLPADKTPAAVTSGTSLPDLESCAFMGTVVRSGGGSAVVIATGIRAEFGRIAAELQSSPPTTSFQDGLRRFSTLLLQVAVTVSSATLLINLVLGRPLIESLLFSTAVAVGITPQLLPAVVSTSLAAGSRSLAQKRVLVKRLVCIEDLGNMTVLVTDKTGTLTQGEFAFLAAVPEAGRDEAEVRSLALLASAAGTHGTEPPDGDPLDLALWQSSTGLQDRLGRVSHVASLPFDHVRRMTSTVVQDVSGRQTLIVKGAPESVLAVCAAPSNDLRQRLADLFNTGRRVIAVASRPVADVQELHAADEQDLHLIGLLVFDDPVKPEAAASITRLTALDVRTVIASGDNVDVTLTVASSLGLSAARAVDGAALDAMDDQALSRAAMEGAVFARVSPENKARLVKVLRTDNTVGFMGDGVNDALALHDADVGISVDTGADVAKDAADVVLLEKSLDVVANGLVEGRRIFANTMKYVLMGTSSNFGNVFSAAAASALLPFLPMLPSQLLLNNLLYDAGQLAIPTDNVDDRQLERPSSWDIGSIKRFMFFFGPLSSLFDFVTFGVLLGVFDADRQTFRTGWFVESLLTQTVVVLAVRTSTVPFYRSRPSNPLLASIAVIALAAVAVPMLPLPESLGFTTLSPSLYAAILLMALAYLALIDFAKRVFYTREDDRPDGRPSPQLVRRASRFTSVMHKPT